MPLTKTQADKAQATGKDYKLADAGGLHLFVTAKGHKSWRMKYRFGGKERRLLFGPYPDVSFLEARDRRDSARRMLRDHVDPAIELLRRKSAAAAKSETTFERIARAWFDQHSPRWVPVHASDVITSLERDIFPDLGSVPITDIDAPMVLATLRKVERRGSIETAKRLRQRMSAVFVHAISEGIATTDPAAIVRNALKPLPRATKQPAMVELEDMRAVLRAAESSGATPVVKLASRLLALTAVRPGVIRGAAWGEFEDLDWDGEFVGPTLPLWRIPAERMKLKLDLKGDAGLEHVVPLSRQAVDVMRTIRRLTARSPLVFPGQRHSHRPMSENAIGYLYNRCGFHARHVPHGWRAAFSTMMNARAVRLHRPADKAIIELMLAHVPDNKVAAAYDRAGHMERRRVLAQEWADLLLASLAPASELLTGPRK